MLLPTVRTMFLLFLAVFLTACDTVPVISMRADPLKSARICTQDDWNFARDAATKSRQPLDLPATCTDGTPTARVHQLIQDSQQKCAAFVVSMFQYQAQVSTGLDITATVLSATATAVTRIKTANALSAGATIASGSKSAIRTEYMNSLTIANIVQAVQASYSDNMAKYIKYIDTFPSPDPEVERSAINQIHETCSMPAAEGTIQANLAPNSNDNTPNNSQLSFTFTVADEKTPSDVASSFAKQLTSNPDFKAAGISATPQGSAVLFPWPNSALSSLTWKQPPEVTGIPDTSDPKNPNKHKDPTIHAQFSGDSKILTFSGPVTKGETIIITTDTITPTIAPVKNPSEKNSTSSRKSQSKKPVPTWGASTKQ